MQKDADNQPDQKALWNGANADAWISMQDTLNAMFMELENRLAAAVRSGSASNVLDVGCGTGSTTRAVANAMSGRGHCTGIDVSVPMLEAAKATALSQNLDIDFIAADAQDYAFDESAYDLLISRFGVMFFSDNLEAFSNLRRATRENGELFLFAWRGSDENPFITIAEKAARPFFPDLPAREDNKPGPFGLADADRTHGFLDQSGWSQIDLKPTDMECSFPATELVNFFTHVGPLGAYLSELEHGAATDIIEEIRSAYASHTFGDQIKFTAACWEITARAR